MTLRNAHYIDGKGKDEPTITITVGVKSRVGIEKRWSMVIKLVGKIGWKKKNKE